MISLSACSLGRQAPAPGSHQFLPGDGLPDGTAVDFESIPDAIPKMEPLSATGNVPYTVYGKHYQPLGRADQFQETGLASWYGTKFHGRKTSSGEPYDMFAMSAAHRTLPLPSYLKVTNQANGRSVVVRVNDRGPFIDPQQRVIDLSYAAAGKLGIIGSGTAQVLLKHVQRDPGSGPGLAQPADKAVEGLALARYFVQVGAFSSQLNAAQLKESLAAHSIPVVLDSVTGLHKVKVGPFERADTALQKKLMIDRILGSKTLLVKE